MTKPKNPATRKTALDRFLEKVRIDESGCHIWTGALSDTGYGSFNAGGSRSNGGWTYMGAHRFAYEQAYGKISPKMHLDHLCRNRACVNPEHLQEVTPKENSARRIDTPDVVGSFKCGHEFAKENIYINRRSNRSDGATCKTCANAKRRKKTKQAGYKHLPQGLRDKVYERSQGKCEKCGVGMSRASMVIHHRKLRSRGGSDELSNLIGVTASCHNRATDSIHFNPEIAEKFGYMTPGWENTENHKIFIWGEFWVLLKDDGSMESV